MATTTVVRIVLALAIVALFTFGALHFTSQAISVECPEDAIRVGTWSGEDHGDVACITVDDLSEQTQQELAEETLQFQAQN